MARSHRLLFWIILASIYRPREITRPMSTICAAGNHHSSIIPPAQSWLMTYYNNGQHSPIQQAVPTVTTLARHALVTSEKAIPIAVEDCGLRMLVPKEIQAAMAFPGGNVARMFGIDWLFRSESALEAACCTYLL